MLAINLVSGVQSDEEFVFIPDGQEPEDVEKLHDPLYLDISEFNYLNWEGN